MNQSTKPSVSIRSYQHWPGLLVKFLDSMALILGLYCLTTWIPEANSKSTILISLIAIVTQIVIGEFIGLYRSWTGLAFEREITSTLGMWILSFLSLAALGGLTQSTTEISGFYLMIWLINTIIFSLSARMALRWLLRWRKENGIHTRNYAVVGITGLGIQIAKNVEQSPDLGLNLIGYFDDRPDDRTEKLPADFSQKLGTVNDLIEKARQGKIDVIFIALPMRAEQRIRSLLQELSDSTVSVYIVPDLFVFQMLHSRWTDVQGIPIVSVFENPFYGVDGILKRSVDIVLASLTVVCLAIPMMLIAAAVKLSSRGPVFFQQLRYGLDGKPIKVWKFRSMTVMENGDHVQQATRNDSRLTSIGGFLRRSSLDELPQFFNVLTGTMSLVGPRPHANAHNEYYRKEISGYMLRHKVKPGITGLAQVNGCRGETDTIEKMESRVIFDHQYIREWTIWMDLKIMLQTFTVVFSKQNAY